MNNVKIVEFEKQYINSLVDMWNKSGESWGGSNAIHTKESVLNALERSNNINNFIAVAKDEVVGYCSYNKDLLDENTAYIPLLNVRPDCIGKKIGKKLLLQAVKKAIESQYIRLDLHTWPGNDKAVPLYKKCGFFWEKREDTTHLMNFLPYIMKTEAVREYLEVLDWYEDSIREIEVEKDGRSEDNFEYYDYNWKKDDKYLNMEFERRGRGLTRIDTVDYQIKTRVKKQDLVIDRKYEILYEIINKSGKPLEISIKGEDNKNIKFNMDYQGRIVENSVVKGEFYVDKINKEQNEDKTYPCVVSNITINGKSAVFRTGINPKFPIVMTIANQNETKHINEESTCHINIKSNIDEEVRLKFSLPDSDIVKFTETDIVCSVDKNGYNSVSIPCVVKKYGFYKEEISVVIESSSQESTYVEKIAGAFKGYEGRYYGKNERGYNIYNGQYMVTLKYKYNAVYFEKLGVDDKDACIILLTPRLGKPYTEEFTSKELDDVTFESYENKDVIKVVFESCDFEGVVMTYYIELFQNGLVNAYCELKNESQKDIEEIYVSIGCHMYLENGLLPYDGKIIRTPNAEGSEMKSWEALKISENWVMRIGEDCVGLGWDKDAQLSMNYDKLNVENRIIDLKSGESKKTEPVVCMIDTFTSAEKFREYMGNTKRIDYKDYRQSFDCNINEGNPFIEKSCEVSFKEYKRVDMAKAKVKITSKNGLFNNITKELDFVDNTSSLKLSFDKKSDIDVLNLDIDLGVKRVNRKRAIFLKGNNQIKNEIFMKQNKKVYEATNGELTIKASPEFSGGIFSISYKGIEWLDSSFPTPSIKGWWNHWTGGLFNKPDDISYGLLEQQEKSAEFIDIVDHFGNCWSGIKTVLNINNHNKYKGLVVEEYFLLMDGVPIICNFSVLTHNGDEYMHGVELSQNMCTIEDCIQIVDRGEQIRYISSDKVYDLKVENYMVHESKGYKMIRLLGRDRQHEVSHSFGLTTAEDRGYIYLQKEKSVKIDPSFMIFSNEDLNDIMFEDLYRISFDI
ncbi:GNAT family N-acetyltransferase [Clostridiaceae bacterium M8S5]|nr:GNAT family N-acetyltransferase [Clostridiaceae bacterium M8S5]